MIGILVLLVVDVVAEGVIVKLLAHVFLVGGLTLFVFQKKSGVDHKMHKSRLWTSEMPGPIRERQQDLGNATLRGCGKNAAFLKLLCWHKNCVLSHEACYHARVTSLHIPEGYAGFKDPGDGDMEVNLPDAGARVTQ